MKPIVSTIQSKATSQQIWESWERANPWNHFDSASNALQEKSKGRVVSNKGKSVPYKILEVKKGESFTICWKALFLRLIFTYRVEPIQTGSKITYSVLIKGIFSFPIRFILRRKIQKNLDEGLKSFVSSQ